MPFFLLGKSSSDRLYLVAERQFDSRADAMRELGRITASAEFDSWDDEILVIDDSQGAPVLLVRPTVHEVVDTAPESPVTEARGALDQATDDGDGGTAAEEGASNELTDSPSDDLRDALQRTTAHMEAAGINAPESVGLTPSADADPAVVDVAPGAWPWDSGDALSALEEPGDDEGSLVRAAGDEETLSASRPVILGAYGDGPPSEESVEVVAADASSDGGSGQSESGDEGETVIELESEPVTEPETEEPVTEPETEEPVTEPETEEPVTEPETQEPVTEPETGDLAVGLAEESAAKQDASQPPVVEFGPDVEAEEPAGASATPPPIDAASDFVALDPVPVAAQEARSLEEMTCSDCVYVETCPNRDQRVPASCGSFQWK